MPIISINKGAYQNIEESHLVNSEFAYELKNWLIDSSGSNVTRPGLGPDTTGFATIDAPALGLHYFKEKIVAVTESRKIYAIDSAGTATDITGEKLPGSELPVFADDGNILAIAGGGKPIKWAGSGVTEFLGGDTPNATHIIYLDGYFLANEAGTSSFRFSGPVDREEWDVADTAAAEGLPDGISAIVELNRELYLFGSSSLEIFQNFGDTVSPFQRTFFIDRGTVAPYSIVKTAEQLWFLTDQREFVVIRGRIPTPIGEPYRKIIRDFATVSDCVGYTIDILDQRLILWIFPTEERAFWHNILTEQWGEWDGFAAGQSQRYRLNSYVYVEAWKQHFGGDYHDPKIWEMSFDYLTDGGDTIRRVRRTSFWDHGTLKRKRAGSLLTKQTYGHNDSTDTPKIEIRYRNETGPWSEPETIDLGELGDVRLVEHTHRLGQYRQRQYEFTVTSPADVSLQKVEEDTEVMTS